MGRHSEGSSIDGSLDSDVRRTRSADSADHEGRWAERGGRETSGEASVGAAGRAPVPRSRSYGSSSSRGSGGSGGGSEELGRGGLGGGGGALQAPLMQKGLAASTITQGGPSNNPVYPELPGAQVSHPKLGTWEVSMA